MPALTGCTGSVSFPALSRQAAQSVEPGFIVAPHSGQVEEFMVRR
jgi:hypothetical protein